MTTVVYSNSVVAIPRRMYAPPGSVHCEPFEVFATEYGMFIPITSSGYQFLRWVQSGMVDELPPTCSIYAWMIHISNTGEVLLLCADTDDNSIGVTPYASKKFSLLANERDSAEAFNLLLSKCENMAQAVAFVEDNHINGIPNPHVFFVKDWVAHAKEKGYDKTFYATCFSAKK